MRHTTFDISFYCRPSRIDKEGFAPIELSIIINGTRATMSLPRKERPDKFKAAVSSRKRNDTQNYLEAVRSRLNTITTEMMEQGLLLTPETLRDFYQHGGVRMYTVQMLFDEYIDILSKRTELTKKTFRKYQLARDRFYSIVGKEMPVTAITSTVVAEYIRTLKLDYNQVTTNGYLQKVKTVVKYGMSKGLIKIDPFVGVRIRRGEMEVQFLSVEELNQIRDTDFKNEAINRVRDIFIFQASSGMSYCDMAAMSPTDIKYTKDGYPFIHKQRAKTGIYFTSVILQDGIEVLKKYNNMLPTISNQKYNTALKFIQDICAIGKPLHTHIARHTYATRCINEGIRLEVVAKLLGHSTTRITQHYAKLLEEQIVKEVKSVFDVLPQTKDVEHTLLEEGIKK